MVFQTPDRVNPAPLPVNFAFIASLSQVIAKFNIFTV